MTGAVLHINPSFGYFVIDGLELGARLGIGTLLGELCEGWPRATIRVLLGARYLLDTGGRVFPYAGIYLGPNYSVPRSEKNDETTTAMHLGLPLGILWALSPNLALTIGIMMTLDIGLGGETHPLPPYVAGDGLTRFNIMVGFLGVEGFF